MLSNIAGQALNRKTTADFQREAEEFEARKRAAQMQEQMGQLNLGKGQLEMQQMQRQLNAPQLPFSGSGFESQLVNRIYLDNLRTMNPQEAEQHAINVALQSKKTMDARGNVITRDPVFNMSPAQASQISPREAMTQQPMQQPVAQTTQNLTPLDFIRGYIELNEYPPTLQEIIDTSQFGALSPYAKEDLAKAQALEAIKTQSRQQKALEEKQGVSEENRRAYYVFKFGVGNIQSKMGDTLTNPLAGVVPALTPGAQSAEGSVALMAPVLKQLFRESGEGTFTENDQKILMDMLPTRSDYPSVRDEKLKAVDEIVRAKLGMQQETQGPPPQITREQAIEELRRRGKL